MRFRGLVLVLGDKAVKRGFRGWGDREGRCLNWVVGKGGVWRRCVSG